MLVGIIAFVAGFFLRGLLPPFVIDDEFARAFLTSAGFGGLMAVVAAGLAYAAARHTVKNNREQATADREQKEQRERKSQWWS